MLSANNKAIIHALLLTRPSRSPLDKAVCPTRRIPRSINWPPPHMKVTAVLNGYYRKVANIGDVTISRNSLSVPLAVTSQGHWNFNHNLLFSASTSQASVNMGPDTKQSDRLLC